MPPLSIVKIHLDFADLLFLLSLVSWGACWEMILLCMCYTCLRCTLSLNCSWLIVLPTPCLPPCVPRCLPIRLSPQWWWFYQGLSFDEWPSSVLRPFAWSVILSYHYGGRLTFTACTSLFSSLSSAGRGLGLE